MIETTEKYSVVNGVATLVETTETEIDVPSPEEIIAEKEAKLLELYDEIQLLKG
jgi:hypothetical protein